MELSVVLLNSLCKVCMLWTHGALCKVCMLWTHGVPQQQLQEMARATTIASLLYTLPAWWGFMTICDRERLERLVRRLRRVGYLSEDASSFAQMVESAQKQLFRAIVTNPSHVLHHSLSREKSTRYNLHPRAHNSELPWKDTQNFLACELFSNTYWNNHS